VAQMVGRGIALLFHDRGTSRSDWSAARPGRTLPPGKDSVTILQEAGWAPGRTGGKSCLHRDSIPDSPGRSRSLYRMSYRAHNKCTHIVFNNLNFTLKHLKRFYMFLSYDHPQGAYFVPR